MTAILSSAVLNNTSLLYTKCVLVFHNVLKNGQNLSVPFTTCQKVQEEEEDNDDDDDDDGYYISVKIEFSDIPCLLGNLTCCSSVSNVHSLANSLTVIYYSKHALRCSHDGSPMDQPAAYFRQASTHPHPHPRRNTSLHSHTFSSMDKNY